MWITQGGDSNLFVSQIKPAASPEQVTAEHARRPDPLSLAIEKQARVGTPEWQGAELAAAIGESSKLDSQQTILAFSVRNNTKHAIEILPPEIRLSGKAASGKKRAIKAEPVALHDYRISKKRLEPGERMDGAVIFERPGFKESSERLELQLAEAAQVDRPLRLPIPFTANVVGGMQ